MSMDGEVPEGFEQLGRQYGFYRPAGARLPTRRARSHHRHVRAAQHTNLLDICHGGVLMTLGDIAAAWAVNAERGEVCCRRPPSTSFDFISAAREGEWLEAEADRVTVKKRVGLPVPALSLR